MLKKFSLYFVVVFTVLTTSYLPVVAQANDYDCYAEEMLALINEARSSVGIAPLILSIELMDVATIRAKEITRVFSHTRPNGQKFSSLIRDGKYTCGENIAAGYATVSETFEQWMNSTGHRANILREDYTELGVGYFYEPNSQYKHYWVQIFRRPKSVAFH